MAGNDDFSRVLMEALVETLTHDASPGGGAERRGVCVKAGPLRIDLQGVTIDRLVVEVPRE